jgi:Holliday junction resolvase RusA-like endonuclease
MKPITFEVSGKPVPQPRARVLKTGHSYTPDNGIVAYRKAIAASAIAAGATPAEEAPLTIILDFVFVRPKSHFKPNGELNPRTALKKPPGDWDNYAKGVQDALNGIAYVDDSQIGKGIAEMTYGTEARTTVRIQ